MTSLGDSTIEKYAIGEQGSLQDQYSNVMPVFSMIVSARKHTEISTMSLVVNVKDGQIKESWKGLHEKLCALSQCDATIME